MKCPVCGKEMRMLGALKMHFRRYHLNGSCPVCGEKLRICAGHARRLAEIDENHKILYVLSARGFKKDEYYRECVRFVIEKLSAGEVKWAQE